MGAFPAPRKDRLQLIRVCAALLERYNSYSAFKHEPWPAPPAPYETYAAYHNEEVAHHSEQFQRVLWALENDVAKSIMYPYNHRWDSHDFNTKEQTIHSGFFVPALARFLEELTKRKNHRGILADNTVVLIATEMGRHPMLNDNKGKDHFPEISVLLSGPGINTGSRGAVYGATGQMMEAEPVSMKTGKPDAGGTMLNLEDLGTTLLARFGIDPAPYNYRGRNLGFMVES